MEAGRDSLLAENEGDNSMPNAAMRWALLVVVIGLLAGAYLWVDGMPGAAQSPGPAASADGRGEQSQLPGLPGTAAGSSPNVPAPKPGQQKVVLEDLGMT